MGLLVFLSRFAYILPPLHLLPVVFCTSVSTLFCTFGKCLFDFSCNLKVHIQLLKCVYSYQQISQFEMVMFSAFAHTFVCYVPHMMEDHTLSHNELHVLESLTQT